MFCLTALFCCCGGREKLRKSAFVLSSISACVFLIRLLLAVLRYAQPCRDPLAERTNYVDEPATKGEFDYADYETEANNVDSFCLKSTEVLFRFVLVLVSGAIVVGQLAALVTGDSILSGIVVGAQWTNVTSDLVSKSHAAIMVSSDLDVFTVLITFVFSLLELVTAVVMLLWVLGAHCESSPSNSPKRRPRNATEQRLSET